MTCRRDHVPDLRRLLKCRYLFIFCTLLITGVFAAAFTSVCMADVHFPEPDPPSIHLPEVPLSPHRTLGGNASAAIPDTEWMFHKTGDNQHPDGIEQQLLWLMNRARIDPPQEGTWLAGISDPDVAGAVAYFNVDVDLLQDEFAAIAAKPPAAFDVRLYQAAKAHSDYLISSDSQSHNGQLSRVQDAGFSYRSFRGNVYSYTRSGIHGHAGFNIDWGGSDGTGMQSGRGHRQAIMSMDGDYTNVGLAVEASSGTSVGPLVTTGNYCNANTLQADHYNRFLVGTVWRDLNGNDQYDPGEGSGSIEVRPDQGPFYAVTGDSGGYALPILEPGTYTIVFSGSGIAPGTSRTVAVGSQSFLLDLVVAGGTGGGPQAITGEASAIRQNDAWLQGVVNANGQDVDYYFEYGQTIQYGEISDILSTAANTSVQIAVAGLSAGRLYHYRLVVVSDSETFYGNDRSFETTVIGSTPSASAGGGGGGGGCFIEMVHR